MAQSFESARAIILEHVLALPSESVALPEVVGRVIAEEIIAPWDMPRFDNSAMDGFAVRFEDCKPGTILRVASHIPAGIDARHLPVQPGCAARIMTGAPLPPGADTIVPLEESSEEDGRIVITGPVVQGNHVRVRGEDVSKGERVIATGTMLRPAEINMLASFGYRDVAVYRRPEVAILSTGDELVEPGEELRPGQVVNSNDYALAAAVREVGGVPLLLGIARDNRHSLTDKISAGLNADVLVTTAGVSLGDRDFVCEILQSLGVERLFWKLDIKPGRPTAFGVKQGKPVFSLPGNPVSSLVTFEMLVRPALLKMMGHTHVLEPTVKAILKKAIHKKPGRVQFLRVTVVAEGERLIAASAGDQNTGILTTLLRANGIAVLPADREQFEAGDEVEIHLIGPVKNH